MRVVTGVPGGRPTLRRIKQQRQKASSRTDNARDIGGADVAATGLPDVASAEQSRDDKAERNSTEQVGRQKDENRSQRDIHRFNSSRTKGNERSVVYSAPVGFSLLSMR